MKLLSTLDRLSAPFRQSFKTITAELTALSKLRDKYEITPPRTEDLWKMVIDNAASAPGRHSLEAGYQLMLLEERTNVPRDFLLAAIYEALGVEMAKFQPLPEPIELQKMAMDKAAGYNIVIGDADVARQVDQLVEQIETENAYDLLVPMHMVGQEPKPSRPAHPFVDRKYGKLVDPEPARLSETDQLAAKLADLSELPDYGLRRGLSF